MSLPFEHFMPFINQTGLNPAQGAAFTDLLRRLHAFAGDTWLPGKCRKAAGETLFANMLLMDHPELGGPLKVRTFWEGHFWMQTAGSLPLVIDPAGQPESPGSSVYTPYFGLPAHAPEHLRDIYSQSQGILERSR